MNTTILDEVLTQDTLNQLYIELTNSQMWTIGRSSVKSNYKTFPGHVIKEETGEIVNGQLYGFFKGITEMLRIRCKQEYNIDLPKHIMRMHLGAKNHKSFTKFHTDTSKSGVSIVGFLTPEWKPEWEGQLKVENNTIDYEPGRFVIFDTYRQHDGNGPTEDCHLWRISVNIILTHES